MPQKKVKKTPMDAAFGYLAQRPRSIGDMQRHLDDLQFGEYEVYAVVERLKELGYLDDEKYARDFVQSRLATKPASRRKLQEQLAAHHIDRALIQAALQDIPEETETENAMQVAEKFFRQFEGLEPKEKKQRIYRRLIARGYDYEHVRSCLEQLFEEEY